MDIGSLFSKVVFASFDTRLFLSWVLSESKFAIMCYDTEVCVMPRSMWCSFLGMLLIKFSKILDNLLWSLFLVERNEIIIEWWCLDVMVMMTIFGYFKA